MAKLKLSYFDFDGGRGEVARLAMSIGGIDFEDDRIAPADWPQRKAATPFGAIPVLEVDGEIVAQSNGINRYVGKLAGLYPGDPLQAAFCDEAMDTVEEISAQVVATFSIEDEGEKKAARESLAAGPLPTSLMRMERRLESRGGQWFADGRLTVADLKVFVWIRALLSGNLDYLPTELTGRHAPDLLRHHGRVADHPGMKGYYQSRASG